MTSLPGAECGIGVELFDMCYRVRLDHSHFTVLLLSSLLSESIGRLEECMLHAPYDACMIRQESIQY